MQKGQLPEALTLLQKFCRKHAHDAEAFYLLGNCNGMLGRYPEAIRALQQSLKIQPHVVQSRFALGGAFSMLNQLDEAAKSFQAVLKSNPRMAEAHLALADVLSRQGEWDKAARHYKKTCEIQPATAAAHFGLGNIAEQQGDHPAALKHFQQALKYDPKSAHYLCSQARLLEKLKQWREARNIYQKVLRKAPEHAEALGGLIRICDLTGDHEKVEKYLTPLLKKNIQSVDAAVAFLQLCQHLDRCDEALDYADELLQENSRISPASRQRLHMAMARRLDSLGEYDRAFSHLKQGNTQTDSDVAYDPLGHKLAIDNIIRAFDAGAFMRLPRARIDSQRPIFIVGMPRSGTSLTEQILAAHPRIEGAGELTDLADLMKTLPTEISSSHPWPQCIDDIQQADVDRLSQRYLDRLDTVSTQAERITDKMPHNFYLLGLIQLLFPKAHIIHCRRDPLDTCLSIYFQNFQASHAYAQDLFKLGTHYQQYQRLMKHWRQTLSLPVFDLHYEELVSKPESTIQQMLEFCGLEWDNNCLQFHKLDRDTDTASYDQVRQPLYTRSVERWRHYESYLDELKKGLERGY